MARDKWAYTKFVNIATKNVPFLTTADEFLQIVGNHFYAFWGLALL